MSVVARGAVRLFAESSQWNVSCVETPVTASLLIVQIKTLFPFFH